MNNAYIVSAVRTAVGKAPRGTLRHTRSDDLGAAVVRGAIEKVNGLDSSQVEDVVMGCAMPEAEQGFNLGRVVALRAGLPDTVPGSTVNRLCSSGLQSIAIASQAITCGQSEVMVAGGAESMSLIPMGGHQFSPNPALLAKSPEAYATMGLTAENVAQRFHISREDQDAFALRSHQKAMAALNAGKFKEEIIPIPVRETEYVAGKAETHETCFTADEGPRAETSL
ncbi:MAG TPA: beta-ketoacyl synthase N-terminal-like domain-containing protein, partial [Trichocoleus sp.]